MTEALYEIEVETIDGQRKKLKEYKGKALLIVNVASKCGFTPQYDGLQKLYKQYHDHGFEILAFPFNQFAAQEPGDPQEIKKFCTLTYDVTFPLFAKVEVNGKSAHPLFQLLKKEAPGVLGTKTIKWNFTKFLIDKNGQIVKRFSPRDEPEQLVDDIISLLKD